MTFLSFVKSYLKHDKFPDSALPNNHYKPYTSADPGFLEKAFICINVWGFALLILSYFSDLNNLVSLRQNYFVFIRYL